MSVDTHINTFFNSNTYFLYSVGSRDVWLVDCGDAPYILNWLSERGKRLRGIFLTHTHYDHMYGLNEIKEAYPDLSLYVSERGEDGLYSARYNFSAYNEGGTKYVYAYGEKTLLKGGERVELFPGLFMEVVATPGHDCSCMTYKAGNNLFTGDSFIPGFKVVTTFPRSNKKESVISLERIGSLIAPSVTVYPGHGPACSGLSAAGYFKLPTESR